MQVTAILGLTLQKVTTATKIITLLLLLLSSAAYGAITLSTSSTNNTGDFTLSWSAGSDNIFYLYRDGVQVLGGPNTSHALTNVSPGTYVYQVNGCYSQGCAYPSSYTISNSVTVTVTAASLTVLTVDSTQSGGDFTLSYTTGDPVYYAGKLSVYQNGTYIGYTTNASFSVVGKPVGTYSYYL